MPYPQVEFLSAPEQPRRLESCTRGFSDAFGDRLLTVDAETATPLELLRFKPEFSESDAFEAALRDRVSHTRIQDPAIVPARGLERWDDTLLLVSRQIEGRRLSDVLPEKRGPMLALECIRQLVPVLAALAETNRTFAHGALTIDRVIASEDGRLAIVEHPLGAAVESLAWPADRLQTALGLVIPPGVSSPVRFDGRVDVVQLGFVALSMLLGRRIDPAEYPANISKLIAESAEVAGGETWAASRLRAWLGRALQAGPRPLESAREALLSLGELSSNIELRRRESASSVTSASSKPVPLGWSPGPSGPGAVPNRTPDLKVPGSISDAETAPSAPEGSDVSAVDERLQRSSPRSWTLAVVSVVAVAEAAVIGAQWYYKPKPIVVEVASPGPTTPGVAAGPASAGDLAAALAPLSASPPPEQPPPVTLVTPATGRAAASAAANAGPRFGGMTIVSPLTLQVYEGGKLVGVSGGPIAIVEGVHSVELVNEELGVRARETVTVKPGELTSKMVPVPNGRLSINAVPWADVWIDGTSAGQTPLANLSVPVGEHQIVLRHPQFGDQRHTALVKSDGVTRLSANMQR